jgi:hypothetical protein
MSSRRDAAKDCLTEEQEDDYRGYVSDAMGLLREGNYKGAEELLQLACSLVMTDKVRYASLLRKMSVLYEQQDRVDESHATWEYAQILEKTPGFGRSNKLLEFIKGGEQTTETMDPQETKTKAPPVLTLEQVKERQWENYTRNVERFQREHRQTEDYVKANERFVSSVVSMVQEESTEGIELKSLKKNTIALATAIANVRPGETVREKDFSVQWNKNDKMKSLASKKQKPIKKRAAAGRRKKKKQSLEELKKLLRSEKHQDEAGKTALTIALRYVAQKQPKMAFSFLKKSFVKEYRMNEELALEYSELEGSRSSWRSMRDKREGEENVLEVRGLIEESDKVMLRALRGIWELLLDCPIAAFNATVVQLASAHNIEEARVWNPSPPVDENTPKYIYCAAPIAAKFARKWLSLHPQTEAELVARRSWQSGAPDRRRESLLYLIGKLHGVVNGPCGDLLVEVYEELLETKHDGVDVSLIRAAGNLYVRRKHFRRAQELLARAEGVERGESRSYAPSLRSHGDPQLHNTLHIDPAVSSYLKSLPRMIRDANKVDIDETIEAAPNTGRSGTLEHSLKSTAGRGKFGEHGDPRSDTWDNGLLSPGISSSLYKLGARRDDLVVPTTIGRDRDKDPFLRSVGIEGRTIAATGGVQIIGKLTKNLDLRSGGSRVLNQDDMSKKRRMQGQKLLWRSHVGHAPQMAASPQGNIGKHDGEEAPWKGEPQRTWMRPYIDEGKTILNETIGQSTRPTGFSSLKSTPFKRGGQRLEETILGVSTRDRFSSSNEGADASSFGNIGETQRLGTSMSMSIISNDGGSMGDLLQRSPSVSSNRVKTRGQEYRESALKLENLREASRKQVREFVSRERTRSAVTTADRARSPTPASPGGMASWWLDEDLNMAAIEPLGSAAGSKRPGSQDSGKMQKTAPSSAHSSRLSLGSGGEEKSNSRAMAVGSKLDNLAPNSLEKASQLTDGLGKDSLDLFFDSRPSTRSNVRSRHSNSRNSTKPHKSLRTGTAGSDRKETSAPIKGNANSDSARGRKTEPKAPTPGLNTTSKRTTASKNGALFSSRKNMMQFAKAVKR